MPEQTPPLPPQGETIPLQDHNDICEGLMNQRTASQNEAVGLLLQVRKLQRQVADKDAKIAERDGRIARLEAMLKAAEEAAKGDFLAKGGIEPPAPNGIDHAAEEAETVPAT